MTVGWWTWFDVVNAVAYSIDASPREDDIGLICKFNVICQPNFTIDWLTSDVHPQAEC